LPTPITVATGPLTLRFAYVDTNNDGTADAPQTGYIVHSCTVDPDAGGPQPQVSYAPCFVANLQLTVNAPNPGQTALAKLALTQQPIDVQIFGPMAFEQNGTLLIDLRNSNAVVSDATATTLPALAGVLGGITGVPLVGDI